MYIYVLTLPWWDCWRQELNILMFSKYKWFSWGCRTAAKMLCIELHFPPGVFLPAVTVSRAGDKIFIWVNYFSNNISRPATPLHVIHLIYHITKKGTEFFNGSTFFPESPNLQKSVKLKGLGKQRDAFQCFVKCYNEML